MYIKKIKNIPWVADVRFTSACNETKSNYLGNALTEEETWHYVVNISQDGHFEAFWIIQWCLKRQSQSRNTNQRQNKSIEEGMRVDHIGKDTNAVIRAENTQRFELQAIF